MNNQVSLVVILALAAIVIALTFGMTDAILGKANTTITGNSKNPGIIECNPADPNQPEECKKPSTYINKKEVIRWAS